METKWTKWYAMTSHVIAYRSLELLFGTYTFQFNCFFEDFNCVVTQIGCLSRVLINAKCTNPSPRALQCKPGQALFFMIVKLKSNELHIYVSPRQGRETYCISPCAMKFLIMSSLVRVRRHCFSLCVHLTVCHKLCPIL